MSYGYTKTKSHTEAGVLQGPEFCVGDLVQSIKTPELIYMLTPMDNQLPARVNQSSLSGVVVASKAIKDQDGDWLPPIGYYHPASCPSISRSTRAA